MKPRSFDYHRPKTIAEAVEALAQHGDDARILAGGQSLIPMLNFRLLEPVALIDIRHVPELDHIRLDGDMLEVGAAVTQNRLLAWPDLARHVPLLAVAMPWVGHFQTRNRGTVCGSIAHADPSSEIPLSLAMLEGEVVLQSPRGRRVLKASEFQTGMLSTARDSDEMIVAARFPTTFTGKAAFREVARRHGDYAIVAVGALRLPGGEALVGIGGASDRPVVRRFRLDGGDLGAELDALAWELETYEDLHASPRMRRDLVRRLAPTVISELRS
ncbi:MAG: FAD binding domain-containing protein [Beijerinckiaceae bacterium]|jgi:2-furoyl-CoA dehydrogenase FAD binding subunit|nr:FAD binding domain-containing protein [Beijerinckiaceae bacterium]MDO9443439.1 FAD binding domain-containing protein [Beijerinckiaceae bacterium]